MTEIEARYNKVIDDLRAALKLNDSKKIKRIDDEMMRLMLDWCKEAPRAVVEVELPVTNEEIDFSLENCWPLIRKTTAGGFLVIVHGTPDGRLVISPERVVRFNDNRFVDKFPPGSHVEVLACYPGSRPNTWEWNGRHFHNVGSFQGLVPMGLGVESNKVYVREVSEKHSQLLSELESAE